MKKVNMKKIVLRVSGIGGGLFVALLLALLYGFCGSYRHICKEIYTPIAYLFFSFPFLFLFSLISYKMRDEVFQAWWNFARWWVPVIIVSTFLLDNASGTGGGYLGMGQDFIFLIQGILYTILILGSLWKITRMYLRLNQAGN